MKIKSAQLEFQETIVQCASDKAGYQSDASKVIGMGSDQDTLHS